MRRMFCVILMVVGLFTIYVIASAVNNLTGSLVVIAIAGLLSWFVTKEPFILPEEEAISGSFHAPEAPAE